ncbi:DUF4070 domain-containing protein [candidate division KSB1 bacterium]|nr:DUF4070 domain-containing protein [candidate division KSB1 bacterium]RQW11433.1 MAG: DUF4070 domain-containing protein [candidate division KSB1 bacterium]
MKILLVYPETPNTFWSFADAIKFISKKASDIPLGLITVAAMLPGEWEKKLIDMNVSKLRDKDLLWADYVFIGGMNIQRRSFQRVVNRCNQLGVKVVAGGAMATTDYREMLGIDHFVLNEAEVTLPLFLADLQKGCAKKVYQSDVFPELSNTPMPMWSLLDMKKYAGMGIQYSRGCPFDCEFCSITMLNGRKPRTKSTRQFLAELDSLYDHGWRGGVFIVDDNFIGKKSSLKADLLPGLIEWSRQKRYPFQFTTEVSINLSDDEELMQLMVQAGFRHTFVGIETPDDEGLAECGKKQNLNRDLVGSVKKMQRHGLVVSGGFIVGFDSDTPSIFERQINFIQRSGIVTAMVGLLTAPTETKLYRRLKDENRLLHLSTGNNMDGSLNFIPKMEYQKLVQGYKYILETVYSPREYYKRVKTFLNEYELPRRSKLTLSDLRAFMRSLWKIGLFDKGKRYYWRLLAHTMIRYPKKFGTAVTLAIYGFHFRRVVKAI